eukprot:TRINITY_DN18645_c0_g2_i1.p1 TRINITY_DN18645_c0_g2~~TRINITY_DN18645_c0_g2_i1.p1  ORF type:complete len:470 (-),score=45.47 TRINITY_DN18645_c0_g2_i1:147-1445(-)
MQACALSRGSVALPPRPKLGSRKLLRAPVPYASTRRCVQAQDAQPQAQDSIWQRTVESIRNNGWKVLGALALAVALVFATPDTAEAARSGGRVGGSGFSSARSSGGYSGMSRSGGGMGSYRSAPSPSYGRGPGGGNVIHHHHSTIAPSYGFGFGMGMSPFGFGAPIGFFGGGSSLFTLLVLAIFGYVLINSLTSSGGGEEYYEDEVGNEPMSVVTMQIGLLGSARELQRDLNRMANNTDTSTPQGLHFLLTETVLALRRNPQYAVYGKSSLKKVRGLDNCEAKFNEESMNERGKFERETLSNVGGRMNRSVAKTRGDGLNELIVVTIIAAVDGKVEPQDITDQESLKADLQLLGSIPADRLLALEVLWTPQDEGDYFTKDELVTDYPTLNTLQIVHFAPFVANGTNSVYRRTGLGLYSGVFLQVINFGRAFR